MSSRSSLVSVDGPIGYHIYREMLADQETYCLEIDWGAGSYQYINLILPKNVAKDLADRLEASNGI